MMKAEDAADEGLPLGEQIASGKIPIIVPEGFSEHAVKENVYAGKAMGRRANYQYGALLEPGEPGSGMTFGTACSEDILDKNWQRLVMTHLEEKEHRGVLTGAPLTDMRITLMSGRAHVKHTEGGDFRQSVYRAVRQGLMQAESVLLEPFYYFRL